MTTTSATTDPTMKYLETDIEHTLVIDRSDEEQINMCIDHWGSHHTLTLAVFDTLDAEQFELKDQVIFSYAEARLLRDMLNRPEIVALIGG